MASDEMIQRAARVAASSLDGYSEAADHIHHYRIIVRALADAGLLRPATLRAVYAEGDKPPGGKWAPLWGLSFGTYEEVRDRLDGNPGTIIRRWVTEWEEA